MAKRKRKRYDDKFRASAVVMLQAAGYPDKKGALAKTAQHLKVPNTTLRGWYTEAHNPAPSELRTEKEADLTELLRAELQAAFAEASKARPDATWRDLMTGVGIMVDKLQLLENKPTERTDNTIRIVTDESNPDTFTSAAQWTIEGDQPPAQIQHSSNGASVGKNGTGKKANH